MSKLVLTLPAPPSVNNLFATVGKRRIPSKQYAAWRWEALLAIRSQTAPTIKGRVTVTLDHERVKRRKDLDNLSKAPLDALVTAGVIEDDSLIECITSRWSDAVKGVRITVQANV